MSAIHTNTSEVKELILVSCAQRNQWKIDPSNSLLYALVIAINFFFKVNGGIMPINETLAVISIS